MNFKAEPFRGRPPSEDSVRFGEACELARKHLEEAADKSDRGEIDPRGDDDDNVPF
jgi:hypothetical protein